MSLCPCPCWPPKGSRMIPVSEELMDTNFNICLVMSGLQKPALDTQPGISGSASGREGVEFKILPADLLGESQAVTRASSQGSCGLGHCQRSFCKAALPAAQSASDTSQNLYGIHTFWVNTSEAMTLRPGGGHGAAAGPAGGLPAQLPGGGRAGRRGHRGCRAAGGRARGRADAAARRRLAGHAGARGAAAAGADLAGVLCGALECRSVCTLVMRSACWRGAPGCSGCGPSRALM